MAFSVEDLFALSKQDLMFVAQIVSEQAATCSAIADQGRGSIGTSRHDCTQSHLPSILQPLDRALEASVPNLDNLDVGKAVLTREPMNRVISSAGKGIAGPPRPPQRSEAMTASSFCFSLSVPHVRVQRSTDNWELLPTCLQFWETLGLGPASGVKDVRAFCIFPMNSGLEDAVSRFMNELGSVYERYKLGSHIHFRETNPKDRLDVYHDGMAPVDFEDDPSLAEALKAYSRTCADLGKALASIMAEKNDTTIVIYMVNPFPQHKASQYLCACFWLLFRAYRDRLSKSNKSQNRADILLQLIPINLVATLDAITMPEEGQMALLAREVYDRCPPSASIAQSTPSALPILAAPSIELANSALKRILFQLTPHPSEHLMYEGSLLHLAYSRSPDRQWLNAVWMDNLGQHQASAVFCIRGRSFADAAQELWDQTREILNARSVMWRIWIVTDGDLDNASIRCWQSIVSKPRAQLLGVTLLSVQTNPAVAVALPSPMDTHVINGADMGALTPAATPQGTTAVNSPELAGHTPAPPTPAPSESAISMAEIDPDALPVDAADESWGILLCPKLRQMASPHAMASAVWFRRGDADISTGAGLSSLGVSLHWTIQVKPGGTVDEGQEKHAELALRDMVKTYRNLAVLTRARGLNSGNAGLLPVHLAVAKQGAAGLNDFLRGLQTSDG